MEKMEDIISPKEENERNNSDEEIDSKSFPNVTTDNDLAVDNQSPTTPVKTPMEEDATDNSATIKEEVDAGADQTEDATISTTEAVANDGQDGENVPPKRPKTKKELEEEEREKMQFV